MKDDKKFNLALMQSKKGNIGSYAGALITAVIGVILVVSLAPTIFGNDGLNNSLFTAFAPTWLPATLIIVVGAGLLLGVMAVFKMK